MLISLLRATVGADFWCELPTPKRFSGLAERLFAVEPNVAQETLVLSQFVQRSSLGAAHNPLRDSPQCTAAQT